MSDKLRDQAVPKVLGYELDRETLTPIRRTFDLSTDDGDYGCDPLPDGKFRMIPSGDIVDYAEKERRLARFRS